MKSQSTVIWFVLAALLFALIWGVEKYFQPANPSQNVLFSGLRVAEVTSVQISPNGAREISVERTNGGWQLDKPFAYPALTTGVENLLNAMAQLVPALRLTAADVRGKNSDTEFGFENPQYNLDLTAGDQAWHLRIGNKTAPGDQVYIRIVGLDGAFVTDASWLQLLPRAADQWRDTALVDATASLDWIVVTNGAKIIELRRDATNHLWRMLRPLAARADDLHILEALQALRTTRVAAFVNDDPKADLSAYNLQPAELDLWLGRGTNFFTAIHAGKALPENPALIYARRENWNGVLAVTNDALAAWRGAINDFRDPHLLELTAPVAEIEVRGETNADTYTLQSHGAAGWALLGEKFPADEENVLALVKLLVGFRVQEFVKDVVTPADLQSFGLATPARQVTLRSVAGDTNSVIAQLLFSAAQTNKVFVKRADEDFVYSLAADEFNRLPESGWEFRERRLWHFSETNVTQVTLRQNGKTEQLLRTGENKWSLAPGSQGMINPPAIEETVHRLGELAAAGWVGRNITAPEKFGLSTNNLSISIELKNGEKYSVDFGVEIPRLQTALAAVTLDGERWAFVFPAALYQLVAAWLTIPANSP
jgi:hypothetical protein